MKITDLAPKEVWKYFAGICRVPRGSGNEAGVRKHIIEFAKQHNFEYIVDEVGNLVIRKDGIGKSIVLQGHLDMVCEKNSNVNHDFKKDPIQTIVSGDTVTADGTTLGGDDGIGLAIAMALLTDTDIKRPLEALFTVEEETGLTGATYLKSGILKSETMINLDSEDDEEIIIGCAGGMDTVMYLDINKEQTEFKPFGLHIAVKGFTGGHSGSDIDKPRANANKLLATFLKNLKTDYKIVTINGGGLRNAIPREAEAVIAVPWSEKENVRVAWNVFESECQDKWLKDEPQMKLEMESCKIDGNAFTKKLTESIVNILYDIPHGALEFFKNNPSLVYASTNLAYIREEDGKLAIGTSQRSASDAKRDEVAHKIESIGKSYGATVVMSGQYPGWEPKENSILLNTAVKVYKELFGGEPRVKAIHAGLECGLFTKSYPAMDVISIGPKILDIHSPAETLYISTVEKCWMFTKTLCQTLE